MKGAKVVVAVGFQQVRIKDVSRSQKISGAVKTLCPEKKHLRAADKSTLIIPVAEALLQRGIVRVNSGNMENLSPNGVAKVGTF